MPDELSDNLHLLGVVKLTFELRLIRANFLMVVDRPYTVEH